MEKRISGIREWTAGQSFLTQNAQGWWHRRKSQVQRFVTDWSHPSTRHRHFLAQLTQQNFHVPDRGILCVFRGGCTIHYQLDLALKGYEYRGLGIITNSIPFLSLYNYTIIPPPPPEKKKKKNLSLRPLNYVAGGGAWTSPVPVSHG